MIDRLVFLSVLLALMSLGERSALAYLDPGSGSMMLQLVLGGFAAVAVAVRIAWRRTRLRVDGLLRRHPRSGSVSDTDAPSE